MPAIQDGYSINVSNRFDLNMKASVDDGQDSDTNEEIDPLEQLQMLEEQRQRERELKKKLKNQQSNKKQTSNKKGVQFKENKDSNVPKKETFDNVKEEKFSKSKRESSGPGKGNSGDRQVSGDENRRPPRRRNDQRRDRGGDADQFGKSYDDHSGHYNRNTRGNSEGDGRMDKKERPARYERFRGGRGGGHRGQGRDNFGGYRSNYRNDGRDDRGKREFDRRSGSDRSGVRATDKRDGAGPRNWGTPGNEIEETTEVNLSSEDIGNWADHVETQQNEEKQNASKEGNEEGEKKDSSDNQEEEEQGEVEMTLDEWKALQTNASTKKQEFNIRKPGEGEDKAKWNNMKVLHQPSIKQTTTPTIHDDTYRRPTKPMVDVNIRFTDMPMRGGKGGRGARGGRGRGAYRGGSNRYSNGGGNRYGNRANQPPPPDVLNETEFPTLPAA